MVNPYQPPIPGSLAERSLGEHARLVQAAFLFRILEFDQPFPAELRYSCWWWRQKVELNGQTVWFRISWLKIHRSIQLTLPAAVDPDQRECRIQIKFGAFMSIRRFQVWIGEHLAYDEQN